MLNPIKILGFLALLLAVSPTYAQDNRVVAPNDEWAFLTFTGTGTSTESCDEAEQIARDNADETIEMLKRTFSHVFVVSVECSFVNYGDFCWAQCEVTVSVSGPGVLIDFFENLWGKVLID